MHDLLRTIFRLFLRLFTSIEVHGLENIPVEGGVIIAPNHLGTLDVPLIAMHIPRNDATLLAAKKHRKNPLYRWMINAVGGIWIAREEADLGALKAAREALKRGQLMGMAPEGTRSRTRALIRGKPGVAYLATLAKVPIVPIAIAGTDKAFATLRRLRRPHLTIRFGKPFTLPPLERGDREAALQRHTDEIMCRIAAMLPEEYHGVYAGHPRLRELLGEPEGG